MKQKLFTQKTCNLSIYQVCKGEKGGGYALTWESKIFLKCPPLATTHSIARYYGTDSNYNCFYFCLNW